MRQDHTLQRDVLAQLDFDPSINSSHIGVAVRDGIVTLSGHVPSLLEKARAEDVAARVRSVKAVVDEIAVELPGRCETPDELVAQRAYERLSSNLSVPVDRLHISVTDGVVTLRGDVDWQYQREAALQDLRHLDCIRNLRSEVVIKPPVEVGEVSRRIHDALERLGLNVGDSIVVRILGSDVTLSGTVNSWHEKGMAENVAWSVPGVSHVNNNISVQ
jgi:osmotically-inducible protein OsmY